MKKKATVIILTAFLIGSFYNEIYSQDFYRFQANRNVVIAASGLNMRSLPNTKSTKLVNIPYGEKINIIHKDHYGLDTVYTIKTELAEHAVFGHWQKVQYKGYTGYVHNAFLTYDKRYRTKPVPGTNEDYVLLQPGYDCADDFYNVNEYFWYGYYQEVTAIGEEPKKPYRKPISVEFINVAADMSGCGTIVKEDKHLRFIIGSKKAFAETDMENILEKELYHRVGLDSIVLDSLVESKGDITMLRNTEPSDYFDREFFYLSRGERSQLLNTRTKVYRIKMAQFFIEADLDGDGLTDYIFGHGEDDLRLGLYLSSEANDEEVVHLVSLLQRGPCC